MAEGISLEKDDGTWLNVSYATIGLLLAVVTWNLLDTLGIQLGWQDRYDEWYPLAKNLGAVISGVVFVAWLRSDRERHDYFLSSVTELRKVSWPSMTDTRKMTLVVCVVVGVFAVILAAFDLLWGNVLGLLF